MKTIDIPKRSGGKRTICVPSRGRKKKCQDRIVELQALVQKHCNMDE